MTIDILLAVYNGAPYLRAQLDSLLAQTDPLWRLIASDDGSDDGSDAILDEYAARFPERIVRHVSGRRFGNARDHFFYLMSVSSAPFVLLCDQDDVWLPDKVALMRQAYQRAAAQHGADTPLLVFSDLMPVDEALRPLSPSLMRSQQQRPEGLDFRALLLQNVVSGCAMGANRALLSLCAAPRDALLHDWWLAVCCARFGHAVYIDKPLVYYRQHAGNSIGARDVRSARYLLSMALRPAALRRSILLKKQQAAGFLARYEGRLSENDRLFLREFSRPRSGPLFYLRHRALITGIHRLAGFCLLG